MQHQESSFKAADGTNLYFQSWHPEEKPRAIMVLVHGFGDHSGRYSNLIDHLASLGIAFYGYDHRGHGNSDGRRGYISTWSEFRNDLATFLDLIREKEKDVPMFIYGHSMGGLVVLDFLLKNEIEVKGVIASAPLLAQPGISPVLVMISRIMSRIKPDFSVDTKLDANMISRDKNEVLRYVSDPLVHSMGTARLGTEITAAIEHTQKNAAAFNYPLLVVVGSSDALVPPAGANSFFENIASSDKKMNIYEHGFHELHNDLDKQKMLDDMAGWLQKHL